MLGRVGKTVVPFCGAVRESDVEFFLGDTVACGWEMFTRRVRGCSDHNRFCGLAAMGRIEIYRRGPEKSDNFLKAVGFGCFDRNNKVRPCLVRFAKRTGVLDGLVERLGKRAAAGVRRPFECFLRF